MTLLIHPITFDDILPIWHLLWPNRVSLIERNSAMKILGGYDMRNMQTIPTFFGGFIDEKIVGAYGGHLCGDNSYRTRGIYVFPEHRKLGIATQLVLVTIEQGWKEQADFNWVYASPRSWPIYKKLGFKQVSDWEPSETGTNMYCKLDKE